MDEWNRYELIEFFGVLPEEDEDKTYLSFTIEKDGLRLDATFFQYALDVYLDLFREGVKEPAFTMRIEASPGMRCIKHPNGWEALEIGAPLGSTVARIKINPHISVEMIHPPAA